MPVPAPCPIGEVGNPMRWEAVLLCEDNVGGCAPEEPLQCLPRGRVGGDDLQGKAISRALVVLVPTMSWSSGLPEPAAPWIPIPRTVALQPVALGWSWVLGLADPEVRLLRPSARLRARFQEASLLTAGRTLAPPSDGADPALYATPAVIRVTPTIMSTSTSLIARAGDTTADRESAGGGGVGLPRNAVSATEVGEWVARSADVIHEHVSTFPRRTLPSQAVVDCRGLPRSRNLVGRASQCRSAICSSPWAATRRRRRTCRLM